MSRSKLKLYGYKKCSTCRKAEKALIELGIDYQYIDITETPPSATALKKWVKSSELDPKKLFNTSGEQYRSLGIKHQLPELTQADIFKMLAGNGRLIKRPIVTDGTHATVGFKEPIFLETWG